METVALHTLAPASKFKFPDDGVSLGRRGVVISQSHGQTRVRFWKKSPTKKLPNRELLDYETGIAPSCLVIDEGMGV